MVEANLVDAGRSRIANELHISPSTREVLAGVIERVQWAVESATEALKSGDKQLAQQVLDAKSEISALADSAESHLTERLTADEPHRLAVFRIEIEVVEAFKRIYYFAKRIAKLVKEAPEPRVESDAAPPPGARRTS
jgi:phosphate:Na+ symporter